IVAGHIGKVGTTFVVNIKLINIKSAQTEGRVYETVRGEVDALIETIKLSVHKLFDAAARGDAQAQAAVKAAKERKLQEQQQQEQQQRAAQAAAAPAPTRATEPAPAVSTQGSRSGGTRVGPVVLMGVGAVAAVLGGVLGMQAKNDAACANDSTCIGGQIKAASAQQKALMANAGFGVGVVGIGVGLLWYALGGDSADSKTAGLSPVMGPDRLGVAYTTGF
ncbi:MAG TPA: hypothetical protein VFH51_04685, partial [Myxococcota bacterium]|nr:hypothetical protein [Myxococcota bacterium]